MILYALRVRPGEYDADGEDQDEWFGSLRAARRRRAELIAAEAPDHELRPGPDLSIDRVEVADLPRRALALALLNREGFVTSCEEVVQPRVRYARAAAVTLDASTRDRIG